MRQALRVVPEAPLEDTEHGLSARGEGWYVVNARDVPWRAAEGRGAISVLEGDTEFGQLGIHLFRLEPGEAMSMYHWEADQEDFLMLSGDALLIVEGQERPLRAWDFIHFPPNTKHTLVGAGDGPCVVLAVGSRTVTGEGWGGYTVDEVALRHQAGAEEDTTDPDVAYANVPRREHTRYGEGWLPG